MHFASRFQVQRILDEAEEKFLGIEGSDLDRRRCEKIGSQWIYLVNSPIFSGKSGDQWWPMIHAGHNQPISTVWPWTSPIVSWNSPEPTSMTARVELLIYWRAKSCHDLQEVVKIAETKPWFRRGCWIWTGEGMMIYFHGRSTIKHIWINWEDCLIISNMVPISMCNIYDHLIGTINPIG